MAQKRSKSDDLLRILRADLLSGALTPGSKLSLADMSERYDCSTGVLREALPRLVGEGLVVAEPQLGFRVVSTSIEDLRHLTDARLVIEVLVFRKAIAAGDATWQGDVMAAHHVMASLPILDDEGVVQAEWVSAHARFHDVLLSACPNSRLRKIALSLRDAAEIYRNWSAATPGHQSRDVPTEHRRLLEAALSGDADEGASALADHIEGTTQLLLEGRLHTEGHRVESST